MASDRNAFVDALKALAILGVFLVNGMGYLNAPAYPLPMGPPMPLDSGASALVHALVFGVCMAKAWPLLAFLFGHSLGVMAQRLGRAHQGTQAALRSRYKKLLALGAAHGGLVYFGDALTGYAVCGLILCRWHALPTQVLVRKLRFWVGAALALHVLQLVLLWVGGGDDSGAWLKGSNFSTEISALSWLRLNATEYLWMSSAMLLMLPHLLALMLAGMVCARLRLLHVQRPFATRFWRLPIWRKLFATGLVLQLLTTLAVVSATQTSSPLLWFLYETNVLVGLCWLVGAVGFAVRHCAQATPQVLAWLSPAGRYTLVLYLGLSVSLAATAPAWAGGWLSAHGGHPLGHSVAAFLVLLTAWCLGVAACRKAAQRGWRDPLARWLGQSTLRGAAKP